MDTFPDKNDHDSTHMSGTLSTGQKDTGSNKSRSHSSDSGVYVNMEIIFDKSLQSTELEQTNDVKENSQNDNPQPEVQNNDGTALGSKGSTSSVIPDVGNTNALRPPSMLSPPPLPPKQNRKPPGFEKFSRQGTELKVSKEEKKSLNSPIPQTSPVPGGDKDDNQCSDLITEKIPDVHNSCTFEILPKVATKCSPQPSPKPPHKPPRKPPQLNKPKKAEVEEQQQRGKPKVEWTKQEDEMGDKRSRHEPYLSDTNEKTKENTEGYRTEGHLGVAKPSRQILVIFTDIVKGGEEDEGPNNIALTALNMMEDSCLLPQDEKPANKKCASEDPTKPELKNRELPPAKPHIKCCPVPPIKPPQLFSAMKAGIEKEKERRKQEEEPWRHEDTLDKGREEYEGEGNDRGKVNEDPSDTKLTKMSPRLAEMPRGGQRVCLMSHCRKSPKLENTPENQTLHLQSQLPGTQRQNKANGQFIPVPLLREVSPAWVSAMETDSNVETLKWTENKDIQISGQAISKMSSGCSQDTEVFRTQPDPCQLGLKRLENSQDIGETLEDGDLKQTNQKPNARIKVKNLAKKVMCKFKEGREERRRIKAGEVEMADTELAQDARKEEEMKEEEERGRNEDGVGQSAVTETLQGIKRRHATSQSPFGSFKVYGPVKLVAELLSADEWSQFLCTEQSSTADSPPDQTQAENRPQLSSSAQLDVSTDVFEGNPADPEGEPIYENIDLSIVNAEEQEELDRSLGTATPQILVESDTNLMSPRTKEIYDTVEFIQPVHPANTYFNFSKIESQAVLDSSVQKYLIKLGKKRKHKVWKKRRDRSHGTLSQSLSPTSVFYKVPAARAEKEQQPSTVKSGGHSPRIVAKIKAALKEKTMTRAAQPKEDRGK